jgi:hypothetical protein
MNWVTQHQPDEHVLLTRAHWLIDTASQPSPITPQATRTEDTR